MKRFVCIILAVFGCMSPISVANAEDGVTADISADFVSQYIWRGQDLGDFSLQPTLGVAWRGLSLTAWGSTGITDNDDTKESDLTAEYATGGFSIKITDYWFDIPNPKYFSYRSHKTSHVFEAGVGYDFGPLSLNWYTNFAGNDGVDKKGRRAYSSYVEASAPFRLGGLSWSATLGAVPYATSFYTDVNGFAVVNASLSATYDIGITDRFTLPIFAAINTNPCTQRAAFVVGLTIRP